MTDSDLLENYRHVYFRINQTVYEWGWGLILAKEAKDELHADISTLIVKLGLKEIPEELKICGSASSQEGVNEFEGIYFHPMGFSGNVHKDNIEKFTQVISTFESKYFSFSSVDIYNFKSEDLRFYVKKNKDNFDKINSEIN
jgi:hypothetical protein